MSARKAAVDAITQEMPFGPLCSALSKAVCEEFPDVVDPADRNNGLHNIELIPEPSRIQASVGDHSPREAREIGEFLKRLFADAGSDLQVTSVVRDASYCTAERNEAGEEIGIRHVPYAETIDLVGA